MTFCCGREQLPVSQIACSSFQRACAALRLTGYSALDAGDRRREVSSGRVRYMAHARLELAAAHPASG